MPCCPEPYLVTRTTASRLSLTETVYCLKCKDGAPTCPTCDEIDWYGDCMNCNFSDDLDDDTITPTDR